MERSTQYNNIVIYTRTGTHRQIDTHTHAHTSGVNTKANSRPSNLNEMSISI
jgi:hypothetical protein